MPSRIEITDKLVAARDKIDADLKWRGPNDKPMAIITLPRDLAEATSDALNAVITGEEPIQDEPCHGPQDTVCEVCGLGVAVSTHTAHTGTDEGNQP